MTKVLLLLAAPVVLTALTPIRDLSPTAIGSGLALAGLSLLPLGRALGPVAPSPRTLGAVIAITAVASLLLLTPPGAMLLASDLATGSTVIAIAAAAVFVLGAMGRPRKA